MRDHISFDNLKSSSQRAQGEFPLPGVLAEPFAVVRLLLVVAVTVSPAAPALEAKASETVAARRKASVFFRCFIISSDVVDGVKLGRPREPLPEETPSSPRKLWRLPDLYRAGTGTGPGTARKRAARRRPFFAVD